MKGTYVTADRCAVRCMQAFLTIMADNNNNYYYYQDTIIVMLIDSEKRNIYFCFLQKP
jgi:hypothetical protein